ncbi:DNA ligase-1 [Halarchaeum rubridurum]|uniref:DNA ligase n=1 Tax=Halarchaeum rubridurum TaxID=489911 RepID=A0A830FZ02_9EURY|nr:ATP-dependent DNA ligase LigA [Halarchaeum rubridurum]MBP1953366.1 DNA ligase-1 [Halarchaeum rubridurum]GGM65861.1 DNA ligase [Halarchaeum rubridurum]
MQFAEFAARATEIEAEPADLETVALVADLFADAGDDLPVLARFVQGRVFPAYSERKLDVGPRLCREAVARAAGPNVDADDVEDRLAETGDIGGVAASYDVGGQRGLGAFTDGDDDALSVREVYDELAGLAAAAGSGSEDEKVATLFGLLTRCETDAEARYLARLVLGEMRIGVGEGAVRDAVAEAFDVPIEAVARALQVSNDYGLVAATARERGVDGLADIHLEIGRPVKAMLAQAGSVADALDSWRAAAVEVKFDGARVQLHHDPAGETRVFSRNMEDVTAALPEVVEFADAHLDTAAILDGEVVAVDEAGAPLPFQEVLRRFRRKHDVERMREEVRVELRAFDCLHAAGDDLLDDPLLARHETLADLLDDTDAVSELIVSDDPEEIEAFEARALAAGHEGVMLKDPESAYTPGKRGKQWLKRKPDVETLDLVVTGAEWGEGRRAETLGTFLLSARTGDGYATIGKVATGLDDEELADLDDRLAPHVRDEDGQTVDIEPAVVLEVGYEEIQRSPTYSSGYALRFPRFLAVRDDKDPADADTLARVERLAEKQS